MQKKRNGESRRLTQIFEALERGEKSSVINSRRDARDASKRIARERGDESEQNVKLALRNLWYVDGVQLKSDQPGHDKNAHDIEVFLSTASCMNLFEHGLVIPNRAVFVQVKSSQRFIDLFMRDTRAYLEANMISKTPEDHLRGKKLILLNGQLPEQEIRDNFTDQLISMNNYYFNRQLNSRER